MNKSNVWEKENGKASAKVVGSTYGQGFEGQADDPYAHCVPRPRKNKGPFEALNGFQTPPVNWMSNTVPLSFGPLGRRDRAVGKVRCSFDGERVVVRQSGNALRLDGLFYMTIRTEDGHASPVESWVTVGETLPSDGWKGNTLQARIRWSVPNRLASVGPPPGRGL